MTQRKITFNGRDYDIACNFKALCLYQSRTGRDPMRFEEEFGENGTMENRLTLGVCCMESANKEAPTYDDITTSNDINVGVELMTHAINAFIEFLTGGDQSFDTTDTEDDEAPKNA